MSELEVLQQAAGPVLSGLLGAHLERDDIRQWAEKAWQRCQRYGQRIGKELAKQAAERILGFLAAEAESNGTQVPESPRQDAASARVSGREDANASSPSQSQSQGPVKRKAATVRAVDHGMAAIRSLSRSGSSRAIPPSSGGD